MPKAETNLLYCGDNLKILSGFSKNSVDLIYADPPFFSNKNYEIIWGNGAELQVYQDRWKGGINVYIEWMKERIWHCWRVLKETGSMYLHCDWHASHRLRVMMDEVFGERNFQNEIIWCYRGGGVSKRHFARKHDTILFYSRSDSQERTFNVQYTPYSQASQQLVASRGGVSIDGKTRDLERGAHMPDWWTDIISLQTWSPERLGYQTQKPEALLERIIKVSSNPGDIVLDPFCGCGTTIVVAHQLGRKWIGIDVSPIACEVMKNRLVKVGATDIRVIGAPKTIGELKKLTPFQFQGWVIDRIGGTHSAQKAADRGIDGYTSLGQPVQVKQQERVGRNVVDNFETAARRVGQTTGYIIAFSFTKSAYEEAARAKKELEIVLVRVDKIDEHF